MYLLNVDKELIKKEFSILGNLDNLWQNGGFISGSSAIIFFVKIFPTATVNINSLKRLNKEVVNSNVDLSLFSDIVYKPHGSRHFPENYVTEHKFENYDLDVFVRGVDAHEYLMKKNETLSGRCFYKQTLYTDMYYPHKKSDFFGFHSIQFINIKDRSYQDVVDDFDLHICQVAVFEDRIYFTRAFLHNILTNQLWINDNSKVLPENYIMFFDRVFKYVRRGYIPYYDTTTQMFDMVRSAPLSSKECELAFQEKYNFMNRMEKI
jgi:hypothetical protein